MALVKDTRIVLDSMSNAAPVPSEIEPIIRLFLSRRRDAQHYSVDIDDGTFVIRSPDPLARSRGRKGGQLPENLLKCPYCIFATPYQEVYDVHVRSHLFGLSR